MVAKDRRPYAPGEISISILGLVPTTMLAELEELVFYNPNQHRVNRGIVDSLAAYGMPKIVEELQGLRVALAKVPDAQSLFAVAQAKGDRRLAGMLLFVREMDVLKAVHVAIAEDFTLDGYYGALCVAPQLVYALRRVGSRVRGVRQVAVRYRKSVWYVQRVCR